MTASQPSNVAQVFNLRSQQEGNLQSCPTLVSTANRLRQGYGGPGEAVVPW